MRTREKCPTAHSLYWYPADNEQGWECCDCRHRPGEPPGFDPATDRRLLLIKVGSILMELSHQNLICVSNSSHGDGVTSEVAARCVVEGKYDQTSIVRLIMATDWNHETYWKKISDGVLAGVDTRERCACGKLATTFGGGAATCGDHSFAPF